MSVITIHNFKGGVGKTTLTAVLGMGLASLGYRVLLIDFDSQMSLSQIFMNEKVREEVVLAPIKYINGRFMFDFTVDRSAFAMLRESSDVEIHTFEYKNGNVKFTLDIIPGSYVAMFETVFKGYTAPYDQFSLAKELDHLRDRYHFILIDSAPSDVIALKQIMLASDYIIVPEDGTVEAFNSMLLFLTYALPSYIWKSYKEERDRPRVLGVVLTKIRRNSTKLLYQHNDILTKKAEENGVLKNHMYSPPYFGVGASNPSDFILSANKKILSDLIWRDEPRAPIAEVYDKVVYAKQPDLEASIYRSVLLEIPKEVVRRVENDIVPFRRG